MRVCVCMYLCEEQWWILGWERGKRRASKSGSLRYPRYSIWYFSLCIADSSNCSASRALIYRPAGPLRTSRLRIILRGLSRNPLEHRSIYPQPLPCLFLSLACCTVSFPFFLFSFVFSPFVKAQGLAVLPPIPYLFHFPPLQSSFEFSVPLRKALRFKLPPFSRFLYLSKKTYQSFSICERERERERM